MTTSEQTATESSQQSTTAAEEKSEADTQQPTRRAGRRPRASESVWRLQLFGICVALTMLVFRQAPGQVTTDTKLDLIIDPWYFLSRAATFWDPITNSGSLQNQAYGYLFPMGPAFGIMDSIGMPPWIAQRTWESALVCLAFLGMQRLAAELGMRSRLAQVAVGLTYALAPRTMSELTTISSELLPVVVLPWMLIPLVRGASRGSPRVAAALSGLAFAFAGGINATASLAVLPVAAWWLLTRENGPRKWRLIGWWMLAITLASAWWMVPLVVLGRYSPPFLDWIENAQTTTLHMSPFAATRGVTQWVSYLGPSTWPGGWEYVARPAIIVATALLAALALWGLSLRTTRHKLFLLPVLIAGVTLLTFGHLSEAQPAWAQWAQNLLNGPLAPFRNIHKFDPLMRLPLALGVGYAVMRMIALTRERPAGVPRRRLRSYRIHFAVVGAALAIICAMPLISAKLAVNPRVLPATDWWAQTGQWLEENTNGQRALVVPGSPSPAFVWGSTVDDPMQPVATTPWGTRDAVPLTNAGYIRFLDSIEQALASGTGDDALADSLRRAGIGYVVLRNDLDSYKSLATPTEAVRASLTASPDIEPVAHFGPTIGFAPSPSNVQNGGMSKPRPAVEIYQVANPPEVATLVPQSALVQANGSADNLTTLLDAELGPQAALSFDPTGTTDLQDVSTLLTDGIRKQQAAFGGYIGKSRTLTDQEGYLGVRKSYDYLPPDPALSAFTYAGIKNVNATSSGDSLYAAANAGAQNGVWSALDGVSDTAWLSSSPFGAIGESITVTFDEPWEMTPFAILFPSGMNAYPTHLEITTDEGVSVAQVNPDDQGQLVPVPEGTTESITIQALQLDQEDPTGTTFGIADLEFPGVTPQRFLDIPGVFDPSYIHFEQTPGARPDCRTVLDHTYCDAASAISSEEQSQIARQFTLESAIDVTATAKVALVPGEPLNQNLDFLATPTITASSGVSADPRVRAQTVLDDDPTTYWQAREGDETPTLTVNYGLPVPMSGLEIDWSPGDPIAKPEIVTVNAGGFSWTGEVPDDGVIDFGGTIEAPSVTIEIVKTSIRQTTSSFNLRTSLMPAGISTLTVIGAPAPTPGPDIVTIPCGFGPSLVINGQDYPTQVTAPRELLMSGAPVDATVCGDAPITLPAGQNQVSLTASGATRPVAIDFAQVGLDLSAATSAQTPGALVIQDWSATERTVSVDSPEASVLVVHENANAGWQASIDGKQLRPITIGGWQQGYLLPAGTKGTVTLEFTPAQTVRDALGVGAVGLAGLGFLAVWPARPRELARAREARPGRALRIVLALVIVGIGYAVAGPLGLVVGAGVLLAYLIGVRRGLPRWAPLLPVVLMATATGFATIGVGDELVAAHSRPVVSALTYAALACCAFLGFAWRRRRPDK
ncbi:DUF3367 domain-containing protein [Epidermidibacterium keratini]|uniref:DUF3367 domain-containing protein n=1 Tax=Epidermidibacterium keratini TaxID=1891644 RepID=A0A7L4YJD7_9ACTN|nr:alpha-(1->3)-arabinofuranosyltransferase family protein [Epidermidibacterium keratini]QHB99410.1 DUF3367 domain-containing protein [Epidermidibacterium keratini]